MSGKTCVFCGAALTEENIRTFDGEHMCRACYDKETVVCAECGSVVWSENAEGNERIPLCRTCYENSYTHCENCGTLLHVNHAYYEENDYPYCRTCYESFNHSSHDYGYKPEPVFFGHDSMYFGVELEVDEGGEDEENAEMLLHTANRQEERMYIKHDGSITEGFELVSHPMTLDYHTNKMNWKEVLAQAVGLGYLSHQTSTCGLHFHVNRTAFGVTEDEQEQVVARIVYFVEKHWNELLKFSRRSEAGINRWASRYGISENTQDTYKKAKYKRMGRYVAVNLENAHTVEFRMFRGTLCYATFIASLQLVHEICKVCNKLSDTQLESLSWSGFVSEIQEKPELIRYLKEKRLYVNQEEKEREEI